MEILPILLFALLSQHANSALLDCSSKLVLTSMHLQRKCCSVSVRATARASLLPSLLPPTSPRIPQCNGPRCFSIASYSCYSERRYGACSACSDADRKGRRLEHPNEVSCALLAFAAACDDAARTDFDFPHPCCPFTSELEPPPILLFALLCQMANSTLLDCSSKLVLTSMQLQRECCSVFVRATVR
jgi:hypothetical protein